MGRLNAKVYLKTSEMAGNESKINKRDINFDNCSLFLTDVYSSYYKKRSETKSHDKWGQKPFQHLPLRGACLVPCTGHASVCHSATDANEGYVFNSVEEFNF